MNEVKTNIVNKTKTKRGQILISAYICEPEKGSEPGMGWNWIKQISKYHDIWLLTAEDEGAENLRNYIKRYPQYSNIHVIRIKQERYGEHIWSHLYYVTYYLWQRKAYLRALELRKTIRFDAVHQLNITGFREPGFLWKLGLPMIWGPITGHHLFPWKYLISLGPSAGLKYLLRNILNLIQMNFGLRIRKAIHASDIIMSATSTDQKMLLKIHKRDSVLFNETGCEISPILNAPRIYESTRKLNIVWSGLFMGGKALNLALHTLYHVEKRRPESVTMQILGTGPLRKTWMSLAKNLNIEHLLHWHGYLPRNEAIQIMNSADLLFFTSLAEGTPAVVMEALQIGLPVLCHDTCGFGDIIDSSCGIKIPVVSPKSSINYFANAICDIVNSPTIIETLSKGAIQKALDNDWDIKGQKIKRIYDQVL